MEQKEKTMLYSNVNHYLVIQARLLNNYSHTLQFILDLNENFLFNLKGNQIK